MSVSRLPHSPRVAFANMAQRRIARTITLRGVELRLTLVGSIHRKRLREALARSIPAFDAEARRLGPTPIRFDASEGERLSGVLEPGAPLLSLDQFLLAWECSQFATRGALLPRLAREIAGEIADVEISLEHIAPATRGCVINSTVRAHIGACERGVSSPRECEALGNGALCGACVRYMESKGIFGARFTPDYQMELFKGSGVAEDPGAVAAHHLRHEGGRHAHD